ncbi:LptA/OstA family protein [Sphingomonas sp. J315]|uniref:LptA/OstA family protein n=1 Tax=Sphingomonas sp. J315 TaxID=2898433 RepID=UPI0021ADB2D7|nr:LptA/OstA family protein [Sphingomonas sp. J315]UUX98420.1 LptA/OstA family protein [Sphingomonas sp. J315]
MARAPRPLLIAASAALLTTALIGGAAVGQSRHDSSAPINFDAQNLQLDDRANRAILSGGVKITQANLTLSAARVTVTYSGQIIDGSPAATRFDASGGVTVTRPDQTARAQYGVYDINRRVITMLGNVTLTQGGNTVSGGRLTIDLDSGRAAIDGSGVATTRAPDGTVVRSGGRVTGRFTVPDRD